MLELAILGLLREQELHGYELKKRLGELLGGARSGVSFGSLYPALARLEKAGHVKAVEANTSAPRPPMSGSLAGEVAAFRARRAIATRGSRGKKVYGLTERGQHRLLELLVTTDPADDRTFAVQMAFCGHLEPAQRLELFRRRRAELADRLDDRSRSNRRVDTYLRALVEHDRERITHDLAWLDELIAGEVTSIDASEGAPSTTGGTDS
jgi:DNA-binding PadR family transcriptional regulator